MNGVAYYPTDKYREYTPRLTYAEQVVMKMAGAGPGTTMYELRTYSDLARSEVVEAISSLLEQELLAEGPVEGWMEK